MLKLENVSKYYYNKGMISSGFSKINLELKLGEFVAITGESGSGKSTLLNVISGLDSYEEGEMYINGKETSHYTERDFEDYRRKYISNIFQNFNLINSYTVYQNIELVLLLNGYKKNKVKEKILDVIAKVGLTKFKNTRVSKLSGGQKQKVAIARAMIKDTPIIVADEPTGNLDSKSAQEIIDILKKVAKDKLVIIATHNIEQIENVATRIVKMHDGKIIENVEIKSTNEEKEIVASQYNNIKILNKYRLGFRNTFNIASKFLLLFTVFFFMSLTILIEYSSFQMSENEAKDYGYSLAFLNLSKNRIIINKKDRTSFSDEDYEKIRNMKNVDYIVENDLLLDNYISFNKDDISFYSTLNSIYNFRGNIDVGRIPEQVNEVILEIRRDNFYIVNRLDEILNKTFSIMKTTGINSNVDESVQDLIIVGIKYGESMNSKLYMSNSILNKMNNMIIRNYCTKKILLNNKYVNYEVLPSDKVEREKAIVEDDFKYQFKDYKIKNKEISIHIENIYYNKEIDLIISNTYTSNNFKRITGYDNYKNNRNIIFINSETYNDLYETLPYQSSVFVKETENIEETIKELEKMNLQPKKVTDFKVNTGAISQRIIKTIKVVVTIFLIIVLFFISYIIIKIILKSRNIYYTTLRILGASYKNIRSILNIELSINATIAYTTLCTIIYCIKLNIVNFEYASKLSEFLSIKEYLIVYVILLIISKLISIKFTRSLFKNTTINTYNEEV